MPVESSWTESIVTDKSFIELAVIGDADLDEIDDFVGRWHDSDSTMSLHEYLGVSFEDYSLWVSDPGALRSIVERRRSISSGGDS